MARTNKNRTLRMAVSGFIPEGRGGIVRHPKPPSDVPPGRSGPGLQSTISKKASNAGRSAEKVVKQLTSVSFGTAEKHGFVGETDEEFKERLHRCAAGLAKEVAGKAWLAPDPPPDTM